MATKKVLELNEAGELTGKIHFTFDDKTVQTLDVLACDQKTQFRLMVHGGSQKGGDSYASAAQQENPLAFAKQVLADTIKQLYAGDWRAVASSGPRATDLAVAMSRVMGKTLDECVAYLELQDDDQKKVWRGKGKIKAMLATIAAEKAVARAAKLAAKPESETTEEEELSME